MGDGRARWEAVVRGVIAGNIFDLGAVSSSDIYTSGQASLQHGSPVSSLLACAQCVRMVTT